MKGLIAKHFIKIFLINGTFERAIGDMVILSEYPNQYRKDTKIGFKWLNENATIIDFENLDDLLTRLVESTEITSEIRELFNRKVLLDLKMWVQKCLMKWCVMLRQGAVRTHLFPVNVTLFLFQVFLISRQIRKPIHQLTQS